jgi:hypothetical protein
MFIVWVYLCDWNGDSSQDVYSLGVFVWLKWRLKQGECYQYEMCERYYATLMKIKTILMQLMQKIKCCYKVEAIVPNVPNFMNL